MSKFVYKLVQKGQTCEINNQSIIYKNITCKEYKLCQETFSFIIRRIRFYVRRRFARINLKKMRDCFIIDPFNIHFGENTLINATTVKSNIISTIYATTRM